MKFKELKNQIKEEQKESASQIRSLRKDRESTSWLSFTFRHKHIAYCQFFNKTPYEKIEHTTRSITSDSGRTIKINNPNTQIIDKYMKEWEGKEFEEDVRDCA